MKREDHREPNIGAIPRVHDVNGGFDHSRSHVNNGGLGLDPMGLSDLLDRESGDFR